MKLLAERLEPKIPIFSLVISVVVAWLVVPPITGFPMIAFSIFFVGLSSLIYFIRKEKTWFDTMLYACILLLSFFIIYRANAFLQFFDFMFIIFFGSVLIRPLINDYGVFTLILSPLLVIKDTLIAKNIFPYIFKIPTKYVKASYVREYLPTIVVTILIMLITVPLLASANPFFNSLLQQVLQFFNLEWLFRYLFVDSFIVYVIRVVALLFLTYFIPRVIGISTQEVKTHTTKQWFSINYAIPKITMAGLLVIFFITQLQLYFATPQTLQNIGYTNSRLTNEVFAQVTVVAFIVFLLTYLDKSKKLWNTRLTYFLVIEAFFLIGIAFKSVYDYSSLYGFTQKRLWGYTSMVWLTGALAAFIYHYKNQTSNLGFMKQVISYTVGIVLLVNILNFDYVIAHYSKPTTIAGIDYIYLSDLSTDAHNYKEVLPKLIEQIEKDEQTGFKTFASAYHILATIDYLKYKYGMRKDINSFNISEYQEYLTIKDINVAAYRKLLSEKQQ